MTVGERIKELRKSKNLTQAELGAKLGVSASMIGQYENGFRRPKRENLLKIIDALSVDLGCFFAGLVSLEQISEEMDMPVELVKTALTSPERLPRRQRQQIIEKVASVAFLLSYELNPQSELTFSELYKQRACKQHESTNYQNESPAPQSPYFRPLVEAFELLNEQGKQAALERVAELAEIPKYQSKK